MAPPVSHVNEVSVTEIDVGSLDLPGSLVHTGIGVNILAAGLIPPAHADMTFLHDRI